MQQTAEGQVCRKVTIAQTAQQEQLLKEYVAECRKGRYFIENKGIVQLSVSHDKAGQLHWWVSAMIDDRYKDNPPKTYGRIDDEIILVYQADSAQNVGGLSSKAPINACLESVIQNRVYQRPSTQERYIESIGPNGERRKYRVNRTAFGNYWNSKHFVFKSDGTYSVLNGE
ncbi:hypothetical protein [Hymenobacter ruricola]|uniref:Uncharacterized protein n=1 Tax=Hymenobacter ruricola TaxID=2791023 RepID=A0ABS0I3D3_9BACT|nr:hypothetical protein [Hymenobacter ruricola]MBF9221446.1 hypothetical protein [Hymenobacter ruricola]